MGAGSSIPIGQPSVKDINKSMLDWSSEWAYSKCNPENSSLLSNQYEKIWNVSKVYFNKDRRNAFLYN